MILSRREARRLMSHCPKYLQPLVHTALATGMRQTEILALRWQWVDMEASEIQLPEGRIIPLNRDCRKLLRELRPKTRLDGSVFNTDKSRLLMRKDFQLAADKAGIGELRWTDLRHTATGWMVQQGKDLYWIAKILGLSTFTSLEPFLWLAPEANIHRVVEATCLNVSDPNGQGQKVPVPVETEIIQFPR